MSTLGGSVARPLRLPPVPKAQLCALCIPQIVQHPGQAALGVGILGGHCEYPLLEGFDLAQFALRKTAASPVMGPL